MYVFLCALMGMILFAIFHRSLVFIYYMLLNSNFEVYSMGVSEGLLRALDFFTLLVMLFFGGWYGTALGLHWYRLVYEGQTRTGLFHGFVPHHWRKHRPHAPEHKVEHKPVHHHAPAKAAAPARPAKIVHIQPQAKTMDSINVFEQLKAMGPSHGGAMPWDFDDIDDEQPLRMAASKSAKGGSASGGKPAKRKPRAASKPKATKVKKPKTTTKRKTAKAVAVSEAV